jgi:hypothetical protein
MSLFDIFPLPFRSQIKPASRCICNARIAVLTSLSVYRAFHRVNFTSSESLSLSEVAPYRSRQFLPHVHVGERG